MKLYFSHAAGSEAGVEFLEHMTALKGKLENTPRIEVLQRNPFLIRGVGLFLGVIDVWAKDMVEEVRAACNHGHMIRLFYTASSRPPADVFDLIEGGRKANNYSQLYSLQVMPFPIPYFGDDDIVGCAENICARHHAVREVVRLVH